MIVDSGSVTVQLTVTSLTYHPLFPSVPLTLGVITGGVVSLWTVIVITFEVWVGHWTPPMLSLAWRAR